MYATAGLPINFFYDERGWKRQWKSMRKQFSLLSWKKQTSCSLTEFIMKWCEVAFYNLLSKSRSVNEPHRYSINFNDLKFTITKFTIGKVLLFERILQNTGRNVVQAVQSITRKNNELDLKDWDQMKSRNIFLKHFY